MKVYRGCSGWQGWVDVGRGVVEVGGGVVGGRDGWRYIGVAGVGGGG